MKRALGIAVTVVSAFLPVGAVVDIGLVLAGARIERWEALVWLGMLLMLWGMVMSERKTTRIWRGIAETWRAIAEMREDSGPRCYRSGIGAMVHGPGCSCDDPGPGGPL